MILDRHQKKVFVKIWFSRKKNSCQIMGKFKAFFREKQILPKTFLWCLKSFCFQKNIYIWFEFCQKHGKLYDHFLTKLKSNVNLFWRQKDFRHQRKVFGKICFSRKKALNFPMFLTNEKYFISNLSKTWENLRPVFSTKKKIPNHGKKEDMWKYNRLE